MDDAVTVLAGLAFSGLGWWAELTGHREAAAGLFVIALVLMLTAMKLAAARYRRIGRD
jgi:hypothetical protein